MAQTPKTYVIFLEKDRCCKAKSKPIGMYAARQVNRMALQIPPKKKLRQARDVDQEDGVVVAVVRFEVNNSGPTSINDNVKRAVSIELLYVRTIV
mmetsp:Transcript_23544/g.55797  ORF Transcript_23544/g.55797 Transcript_23544/m.55797 type:complete len:95 (+) Transcript_23544:178-462(+)